jgi:hypothetical protein
LCPWSISPDGRFLVISRYVPETGADLLRVDLAAGPGPGSTRPLVVTPGSDYGAAISPNGQWFAYLSDESGRGEILIDKFPEGGQKTRVGFGDQDSPIWSPDGWELFFTAASATGDGRDMMAAHVEFTPTLRVSAPRRLFSGSFVNGTDMGRAFAVAAGGRRFLMARLPPGWPALGYGGGYANQLLVVQNWFAELRRSRGETVR